jgi:hypothetical protein
MAVPEKRERTRVMNNRQCFGAMVRDLSTLDRVKLTISGSAKSLLLRTILSLGLALVFASGAAGQAVAGSFRCDYFTAAIDRLPAAKFVATTHDLSGSQKILQADFSGFDPLYSLESIHFEVLFVQDIQPLSHGR